MTASNKHEITNKKLEKKDYFRIQTQAKDRQTKFLFAIIQTFMSERHPKTWGEIRDETYNNVVKKLVKALIIMMDRDPKIVSELRQFMKLNISDKKLLEEANKIIDNELRRK